jgi:heme-degrading monooxygenase HmoA
MYARLTTFELHPETLDEAVQIFRDSVVPDNRQQPGFQGILALVDRSAHKAISISLWQTEAEAQASATSGHLQAQIKKFASHMSAPPVVETFEVEAQE